MQLGFLPACIQVIHFKSPTIYSSHYLYASVVTFSTSFENIFCCSATMKRQMQKDDTICLGECKCFSQLLIPAGSGCSPGAWRKVRQMTPSLHFLSTARDKCFKTRIMNFQKDLLRSRNKITIPVKFASVAMDAFSSSCPDLLCSRAQTPRPSPAESQ